MIRVLLVDDEPLVLIGMRSMLDWAALGYELAGTARNGGEALEKIRELNPKGSIFTGGPNSVYDATYPHYQKEIFDTAVPIQGICYGSQLMAYTL